MAGPQANIRNFYAPLRGPGRTAPSLLEDVVLFDPRQRIQPGYHLLEDGPRNFASAQHIGELLPSGSCLHDFCLKRRQSETPPLDARPDPSSIWRVAAFCRKCRIHLDLTVDYTVAWKEEPCPTWEHPLHHLVRSTWRQDAAYRHLRHHAAHDESDEIHVYECSYSKCSAIVTVHLSPPVLPEEAVHVLTDKELLRKRTSAAFKLKGPNTEGMKVPSPLDVLADLRTYLRNAWGTDKPMEVNVENRRFVVRFGPGGTACKQVLEHLGFELKNDEFWIVPHPHPGDTIPLQDPHNQFLDNAEAELEALILTRPPDERQASQDQTKLESAWQELSRVLSCQNYDLDPASRTAKNPLKNRRRPFTVIGIPEDASDELVVWAYQRQIMFEDDSPQQTAKLMTALEDVQRLRQSEKLSSQVAIERSIGRYGEQTIADAYRSLGLPPNADPIDEIILGNFHARLVDAPMQEQEMRESLAVLGEYRNSKALLDFARNTVSTYEDALQFLDAQADTDDAFMASMFTNKINDNAANREMAQKALQMIADHRDSDGLKSFIAAGYQGDVQENNMDVGEAFAVLQVEDRTIEDEALYTVYLMRRDDEPHNQPKFDRAIKIIAEDKNSTFLKTQLQMPITQQPVQPIPPSTEPIGLDNIGNTCYLNSLLQSLFTIVPVREIVLNFNQYKAAENPDDTITKRVGQRKISEKEVRQAQGFVMQLAGLFQQMIISPERAIRPAQELARLTLETETAKVRRRSTVDSKRRPTLGAIEGRPVLGPLPQGVVVDNNQPLNSPELVDAIDLTTTDNAQDIPNSTEQPKTTDDALIEDDGASDKTLVSQPTPNSGSGASEDAIKAESNDVQMQDSNGLGVSDQRKRSVSELMNHVDIGQASENAHSTTSDPTASDTPATEHVQEPKQEPPQYAPPPGKPPNTQSRQTYQPPDGPPPIPPRPIPLSTLEEYARQQDVQEVLAHAVFQLACAIRGKGSDRTGEQMDEIHDTFYGIEQRHVFSGKLSPPEPVQFLFNTLGISNEPKDLYAALDNYYDVEPLGDNEVYTTITKVPPVLGYALGRVEYERSKINHHVDLPNTIYMDRYMDASEDSLLVERRKQTWQYKRELRQLKTRAEALEPKGNPAVDDVLDTALAVIQHLSEISVTEKIEGITLETEAVDKISELAQAVRKERADLKTRIAMLEQQIQDSFTDAAFRQYEYKLHAAFFHRGTVGSGHYWIYIFDHINEIWRKYNDDHVTHVTNLKEIFGDPREDRSNPNWSSYNPANPYFLIYVRSDQIQPNEDQPSIVDTVRRNPIPRQVREQPETTQPPRSNTPFDDEGIDLHPLGADVPSDHNFGSAEHHEFTGQQSQMTYMPPDAPHLQGQDPHTQGQEFDNIGAVMGGGKGPSRPTPAHTKQISWDEKEMRLAIERSMHSGKETVNKSGDWDDSENMAANPNTW